MWRLLVLLSFVLVAAGEPVNLGADSFQPSIDSGIPHFVKFFAPWCGHCKRLAPTWDELSDKFLGSGVTIAKVDCTQETKLCADHGVRGYPTLKLFVDNEIKDYRGSRDIKSLMDFVTSNTNSEKKPEAEAKADEASEEEEEEVRVDEKSLAHLTDDNFNAYLSSKPGLHFVKFYAPWCGHCQRLAPTWDELAAHFDSNSVVHISKVDCTSETSTCQEHGVRGYPTLLLFREGKVIEKYGGNRELQDLIQFVDRNSPEATGDEEEEEAQVGVMELTSETFSEEIKEGSTFVKFYAPWCGHCKRLAPTWDQLAELVHNTQETITIAKVDCTSEKDLCSMHDVHGYPTLILFESGKKKEEYRGARDLQSLEQFLAENEGK